MKTLNVLTLAMLVGIGSSAVANYNNDDMYNRDNRTEKKHAHHHMRHNDKKDGKVKKAKKPKKMKKESTSSKKMKDGETTRRQYSKTEKYS